VAIAFALLGAFLLFQALQLRMTSLGGGPGPGVLPAALGALLLVIGARLTITTWRERPEFGVLWRVGALTAALVAYAALLDPIGYVIATAAAMVVLLVAFNTRRRALLALLGIAGAVGSYALFSVALHVPLPPDPWGVWR
jgi:putative tricarboxylic transport membrane protein